MFQPILSRVVDQVDGALGAAVLNLDGLTIEAVDGLGEIVAPEVVAGEYASVVHQLVGVSDAMELGDVGELTIEGEDRTTLVRLLDPNYALVLTVRPDAILGRCRFYLRCAAPDVSREL